MKDKLPGKTFFQAVLIISIFSIHKIFPQEGGYTNSYTVAVEDTITFYISSSITSYTMNIFKIEERAKFIKSYDSIKGGLQAVPDSSFAKGCGWTPTFKLKIPDDWKPGVYRAEFPVSNNQYMGVLFFVAEKLPGSFSKNLLILSTNTWQAYNNFGGKSLYEYNSSDSKRAHKVSFSRPAAPPLGSFGSADFYKYEFKFIKWAFENNIKLEYAANYDLDINQNLLNNYQIIFLVGHTEYWSRKERLQLERFIENGGKVIILAGNTCWWQVRFEDEGKTMVCYKDRNLDPLNGVIDSLVTVNWFAQPVNYPENIFTGVSFKHGGYVNSGSYLPDSLGYGDLAALNTYHWIYSGTKLKDGDEFGYANTIAGYEVDGAAFNWVSGLPKVTGEGQTPLNFQILGITPAVNYNPAVTGTYGTMGIYFRGKNGTVFNAATTDWADGLYMDSSIALYADPLVEKITMNVYNKFIQNRFPPIIEFWSPYKIISKIVNGEELFVNKRDTLVPAGESITLSVKASDPFEQQIQFYWTENGKIIGRDSAVTFSNTEPNVGPKKYKITAYIYNDKDTASISWNLFNSALVFSSEPDTLIKAGSKYYYNLEAFSSTNDRLQFSIISLPEWLSLSGDVIGGVAPPDSGVHRIIVQVNDQHNNFDIQNFNLYVTGTVTSVDEITIPEKIVLYQNYPNPFNPITKIRFSIPNVETEFIPSLQLKVYDVLGREVAVLVNEEKAPGTYEVEFNADALGGLASGVYFCQLKTGNFISTNKMIIIK